MRWRSGKMITVNITFSQKAGVGEREGKKYKMGETNMRITAESSPNYIKKKEQKKKERKTEKVRFN
jgi:hypothetical protein